MPTPTTRDEAVAGLLRFCEFAPNFPIDPDGVDDLVAYTQRVLDGTGVLDENPADRTQLLLASSNAELTAAYAYAVGPPLAFERGLLAHVERWPQVAAFITRAEELDYIVTCVASHGHQDCFDNGEGRACLEFVAATGDGRAAVILAADIDFNDTGDFGVPRFVSLREHLHVDGEEADGFDASVTAHDLRERWRDGLTLDSARFWRAHYVSMSPSCIDTQYLARLDREICDLEAARPENVVARIALLEAYSRALTVNAAAHLAKRDEVDGEVRRLRDAHPDAR